MKTKTTAKADRHAAEVSVQRLVEAMGVKLTREGAELKGACPFHEDQGTALVITAATNTWCAFRPS